MKKSALLKFLEESKDKKTELLSYSFSSINIQPSESSSSLLIALTKLTNKTASSIARDNFSYSLAMAALKLQKEPSTLEKTTSDFLKKHPHPSDDCAVSLLRKAKIILFPIDERIKEALKRAPNFRN